MYFEVPGEPQNYTLFTFKVKYTNYKALTINIYLLFADNKIKLNKTLVVQGCAS